MEKIIVFYKKIYLLKEKNKKIVIKIIKNLNKKNYDLFIKN